jgi:nucleoside phosphorylase
MSTEPARPGPLLACALSAEKAALRAGLRGSLRGDPGIRLLRTGMGQQRAWSSVSDTLAQGACTPSALLFTGFGAAVGPGIRPGDLLVATEVCDDSGRSTELPGPEELAGALRRAGLTVHIGPLFSSDRVVRGSRRAELHARGMLGVEMETAGALRASLPLRLPVAAVRVVVDTPEHELLRPGILIHGARAWRALRAAAPVLAAWRPTPTDTLQPEAPNPDTPNPDAPHSGTPHSGKAR